MRMDDIVKGLQSSLNFELLFDAREVLEQLGDLDFGHIHFFDVREALTVMRDCCATVARSEIPDADGKVGVADAAFYANSKTYALAAKHLQHLLNQYTINLSCDPAVVALLDLTIRIDMMALEPDVRQALYLKQTEKWRVG